MGCFCTARRGDGVLSGSGGVLVGAAFCAFEVGEEDKNWIGPDPIKSGGEHIRVVKIEIGRVYIKSDCTVRRRCKCYVTAFGRHFASAGAVQYNSYFANSQH